MGKLLPVLLALAGLGAGAGAGLVLRPGTADHAAPADDHAAASGEHAAAPDEHAAEPAAAKAEGESGDHSLEPEFVKLNNQFVVPVLKSGRVAAMVILSLSLEVTTGSTESVYAREPKLRDAFLQVLFDHSNAGGFEGTYTDGSNLILLRRALQEVAVRTLGDVVKDVLIVDIVRQDS